MYRQQIFSSVRSIILDTHSHLRPEQVTETASLTGDLDMDPSHLDVLISRLSNEVLESDIAFTPWYVQASRGHDSVGSLVDFLVTQAWQSDSHAAVASTAHSGPVPEAALLQVGRSAVLAYVASP